MNGQPWDDVRLAAAFAARASHARTPGDLAGATSAALQTRPSSATTWRRLLTPAAVVILAVGAVTGGMALLGSQRASTAPVEFREGATPDVRTLDARTFAFDFPADWHAYDSTTAFSGLASVAVLGTHPVEARCGDERHVQVNCVNERRLLPGEMRMNVGTGTFFGGTFKDRPSISNGRTVRLQIGGQLAILDALETTADDFYGATESLHLYVEQPGQPNQIVLIDLIARDHGSDEVLAVMQTVIDTFRFDATAFPSPPDRWAGRTATGLPVVTVSDAIAIRDAGDDDQEIAVHGWFSPFGPMSCPYTLATSPIQPVCPDQYVVLMAEPESLVTREANGFSGREPAGPAIQIDLDDLDGGWQPGLPDEGPAQPIEIALVGHFDDRRSSACPADQLAACRDRFVVDRVDWVNGETKPTSLFDLAPDAGRPFDEAQAVVGVVRPQATVLSAVHVPGTDLSRIEPTVADRRGGLVQEEALWIVRVLSDGTLATYLFVDSTGDLYDVTADGAALMAPITPTAPPEPTSRPSPAWGPWPPPDAFSVTEFKDHAGRQAFVAIVDASGLLESVAEGVPDSEIGGAAGEGFFRDPSGAHRYRLRWTTTICDREMTVSIAREVARIVIEHAPREGCDAMAIGRDLVLQFTEDVNPAAVQLQVIEPTRLAEPPPQPTTMVVELERGDVTESVLVVDHAGALMEARAADPVPTLPDFTGVRIVGAEDGGTIVMWDGLLCDRDLWISIEADDAGPPDWIGVHGTSAQTCRLVLVRRAIWLDLGPADVASLGAQMAVGPATSAQRDPGPAVGVAEALVIRSHPGDDHQLQVRGWYRRDPVVYDCAVPPSPPPVLESGCQGPHDRFLADPDDLTGAGFTVLLRPGVETAMLRHGDPSEVVIVGHFDDTLSDACTASGRESCRDVFVIEEVLAEPAS